MKARPLKATFPSIQDQEFQAALELSAGATKAHVRRPVISLDLN
jgi:hypothetical protein